MELAMVGKKDETIVKLFMYIVGCQGREIYDTSFDQEPEKRSFKDIVKDSRTIVIRRKTRW